MPWDSCFRTKYIPTSLITWPIEGLDWIISLLDLLSVWKENGAQFDFITKRIAMEMDLSSFPVVNRVGSVDIFVLLQLRKLDGYSYQSPAF